MNKSQEEMYRLQFLSWTAPMSKSVPTITELELFPSDLANLLMSITAKCPDFAIPQMKYMAYPEKSGVSMAFVDARQAACFAAGVSAVRERLFAKGKVGDVQNMGCAQNAAQLVLPISTFFSLKAVSKWIPALVQIFRDKYIELYRMKGGVIAPEPTKDNDNDNDKDAEICIRVREEIGDILRARIEHIEVKVGSPSKFQVMDRTGALGNSKATILKAIFTLVSQQKTLQGLLDALSLKRKQSEILSQPSTVLGVVANTLSGGSFDPQTLTVLAECRAKVRSAMQELQPESCQSPSLPPSLP